jgi:PAS domain S-box-containing protein
LIVDDHPTNRELLVALLGYKGHRLLEGGDGKEALRLAKVERPDLIISDILMPAMDGYEFVRQLRSDPSLARIPVVFSTAHYLEREGRNLAKDCGVSHILLKPCEPELVLATVNEILGDVAPPVPPPPKEFDGDHLRLLTDKLAQNADELRAVNLRLSALIELSQRLISEIDPVLILEDFCHATRHLIGAKYGALAICEEDGETVRHFLTSGLDAETAARIGPPPLGKGLLGRLVRDRRPFRLRDLTSDGQFQGFPPHHPPMRSFLGVPIVSHAQLHGALYLADKVGAEEFSPQDEQVAIALAAQAAVVYENARRHARMQQHAAELKREVEERRRAEGALETTLSQLKNLFDNLEVVFFSLDVVHQKLLQVSPACEKIYGYPPQAFFDDLLLWKKVIHPDDKPAVEASEADLGTGQSMHNEYRILRRDTTVRWVEGKVRPFLDETGQLVRIDGIVSDITERKSLEEQFRQSQKMEAVGRLAGGIAHDFNNLLTAIMGYSEILLMGISQENLRLDLEEIKKAGERAAQLTRQLLAFSRKQVLEPKVLNLNAVVTGIEKMLRRLIGEDIELLAVFDPALGCVKADPGQIEQVILNLAVNARDAMPGGGKLTVETGNITLDEDYSWRHVSVRSGPYAMLAMSDTGCGMSAEVLSHVFEPFFTTKEQGKGTGLGLSTVYGIVKQSEGNIWVYSEPGRGTTFKIYLPRVEEPADKGKPQAAQTTSAVCSETVLVAEDEGVVRKLACQILRQKGYQVLEAAGGEEAMQILSRYEKPIHLLVTDVVMPQISGRELANRVTALRPEIKLLFMSGYTDDAIVRHGVLDSGVAFLQKPFAASGLAQKVREVLDK